jgi:hypothetical protein
MLDIQLRVADVKYRSNIRYAENPMKVTSPSPILVGVMLSWLMAGVAAGLPVANADDSRPAKSRIDAAQDEFFEAKIRPVLIENCLECHGTENRRGPEA